jgi:WD40 repeat protein
MRSFKLASCVFAIAVCIVIPLKAQEVKLVLPIGHTGSIEQAEFTPDGQKIITLSRDDKSLGIWDAKTGFLITKLFEGTLMYGFHISPDSKHLLVIDPTSPKIVDLGSSNIVGEFNEFTSDAKYSPDGTKIISAKLSKIAKVRDAKTLKVIKELSTSTSNFYDAFFSPKGNYLVTCANDSIKIWDTSNWHLLLPLKNENYQLAFAPDESKYAIAYNNGNVSIFDGKSFQPIITLKKNSKSYGNIQFSSDGKRLFTFGLLEGPYEMWDIETGNLLFEIKAKRGQIMFAKMSETGKIILTRSTETQDEAKLWDAENGKLLAEFMDDQPSNLENYTNFDNLSEKIIAPSSSGIKVYDIASKQLLYKLVGHATRISAFQLNEKYGEIAMRTTDDKIRLLNQNTLIPVSDKVSSMKSPVARFMPKQNVLISSSKGSINFWNIDQQNLSNKIKSDSGLFANQISLIAIDDQEKMMAATAFIDHDISLFYLGKDTLQKKLIGHEQLITSFKFSPDGKYLISNSVDKTTKVWDVETGKLLYTIKHDPEIRGATYNFEPVFDMLNPCRMIFLNEAEKSIYVRDIKTGKKLLEIKGEYPFKDVGFSSDGKYIVTTSSYNPKVWDANTGALIATFANYSSQILQFNNLDQVATVSYNPLTDSENLFRITDLQTGKTLKTIKLPTYARPRYIDFNKNILYTTENEQLKLFDINTGNEIVSSITLNNIDFMNKLPNGYYMATPNATKLLHYVTKDLKVITFEQLDVKYNRPDKVLQAIGSADTILINSYKRAYDKRIKKLNIDTNAFKSGYAVPTADFKNRAQIAFTQTKGQLTLHISAKDGTYTLDRFNVWVNEVPLYGMLGESLKRLSKFTLDTSIVVELSEGDNRIETSVINSNGAESYRMPLFVSYLPLEPRKQKTYFVGIGINHFKQNDYDLNYSVKDIRDLSIGLKAKYGDDMILVDTLFDNRVTLENITKLKEQLLKSDVNDKVIIAYSGHGLLSKSLDYYLSTYDIDFNNPIENGLPYENLENLLDKIPARKKLLLIDACHSGEVDKDDIQLVKATENERERNGVKGVEIKVINKNKKIGMANSFELMRELFVNVGKTTGATIISAAGGTQYALEKGDLKNGVFTYCILELLKNVPTLKISELKSNVTERVLQLTAGAQKPTSRNENIVIDWNVW